MKRKRVFLGTTISACITLLGSLFLFVLPEIFQDNDALKQATSMITIVSSFYTFASFVLHGIAKNNQEEHKQIMNNILLLSSNLSPKYYYPANEKPNVEFNSLINHEVCVTHYHFYFSYQALFHTARLRSLLSQVKRNANFVVALPNLDEPEIYDAMADNLIERARVHGETIQDRDYYINTAREGTFKSIYFIGKLKEEYRNLHLYLHQEIPFIRFELSDNLLAVSFLPMSKEGYYPPSMIYDNKSLFWETFSAYSNQIINRSTLYDTSAIHEYLRTSYDKYKFAKDNNYEQYIQMLESDFQKLRLKET